jgi:hypothetical protein
MSSLRASRSEGNRRSRGEGKRHIQGTASGRAAGAGVDGDKVDEGT